MELVEGEDLAQRIARGAMPLDEALPIARQIAEALEAAHEQGIIHRDLKPANIKVRADGTVKVLDFGLAKALEPGSGIGDGGSPNLANSPTITSPAMTMRGMILGTAAYMAPEQAKGKPVDKRADIWAFGCVLYEMLAGRRAFAGDDVSTTLAAVLLKEPDWQRLAGRDAGRAPAPADALPDEGSQGAAARHRRGARSDRRAVRRAPRMTPARPSSHRRCLAGARRAVGCRWRARARLRSWLPPPSRCARLRERPPPLRCSSPSRRRRTRRLAVLLAGGTGIAPQVAVSPDGQNVVFVARTQSTYQLWLRPVATLAARPLPGTEGGAFPFWSPDSRFIGFFADGKLKKVAIAGGPPVVLCDAPSGRGGSWSRDNVIVFAPAGIGTDACGLLRVSSGGGVPTAATTIDPSTGETHHRWPHFLPDGRHFLYTALDRNLLSAAEAGHGQDRLARSGRRHHHAVSGRVIRVLRLGPSAVRPRRHPDGAAVRSGHAATDGRAFPAGRARRHRGQPLRRRVGLGERHAGVRARRRPGGAAVDLVRPRAAARSARWATRRRTSASALSPDERRVAVSLGTGKSWRTSTSGSSMSPAMSRRA